MQGVDIADSASVVLTRKMPSRQMSSWGDEGGWNGDERGDSGGNGWAEGEEWRGRPGPVDGEWSGQERPPWERADGGGVGDDGDSKDEDLDGLVGGGTSARRFAEEILRL